MARSSSGTSEEALRLARTLQLRQEPSRRILLVDDERIIRDICARNLQDYHILQAASGEEALRILTRETVDLVLTDVMMTGMNGLDLLRTIKERDPNQAVVIMTGLADREVILNALRADADDFISKPIDFLQLQTTVQRVLEKVALTRELVELKRLDRLKSDFLGLISHKLNTPITAISLFLQNLAQGIGDPEDPSFQMTMNLVMRESDYLSALIQDLLSYSQVLLQEGAPQLREEEPMVLAATVASTKKAEAAEKGISLSISLASACPPVPLDRGRFVFALQALLDNALKFTPSGGTVELTGTADETSLRFSIRDTGRGIPPEELPKVFEKFYQVDPDQTGQIRGFGLGLFYARQFVQDQGGTLRLESAPGLGTEATIILPRA